MFELRFDRPMWRIVHDHLATMQIGDTLAYTDLIALLPDVRLDTARGAFARAVKEIEDTRHRTFANVRNVGYRMVEATEHEGLARDHHKRGKRQLRSAGRKIRSADRSLLTVEDRARFDQLGVALSQQLQMIRRLDARVAKQEQALREARRETNGDLALVQERMDRLEAALSRAGLQEAQAGLPHEAA